MLNPPIQADPETQRDVLAGNDEGVVEQLWEWWIRQSGWFMSHSGGSVSLSETLQSRIWRKGDLRELMIWEHPGEGVLYATLLGNDSAPTTDIARLRSPDWEVGEEETVERFYNREIGTRRVAWVFRSPYEPPPAPPMSQPMMMMTQSVVGAEFRVDWTTAPGVSGPSGVQVDFGPEASPGPFTVWRHVTGDLTSTPGLPGDWIPMNWMRDRPTEQVWETGISLADHPNPGFVRATLGIVDSDSDGLDDGFELWFFGDLTETAEGDYDQDGISNLEEYQRNTDPTVADSDADGMKDGDELSLGTNPEWQDHPDVELEVTLAK
ncbi:MAG: thrombospondin type 3 repeat-containing protein [Kiritimatiellae bacterium]|nr:thrombospondin type 3 repeat-containing protein [Kiritimatiellia bacterium]